MGIRVVALDGTRIGWRAAVLRNSVDIAFELISIPCFMMAILSVPDAEYYGGDWIQRGTQIQTYLPSWHQWFFRAGMVWVWSEVFVMLLNKRRRALHDFIAGTIVVQVNPTEKQSQSA